MKVTKSYLKQVILEELQQEVASMDEAQVDESQLDEGALSNVSMATLLAMSAAVSGMQISAAKQKMKQFENIIATNNIKDVPEEQKIRIYNQLTGGDVKADRMLLQSGALDTFLAGEVSRGKVKIDKTAVPPTATIVQQAPVK